MQHSNSNQELVQFIKRVELEQFRWSHIFTHLQEFSARFVFLINYIDLIQFGCQQLSTQASVFVPQTLECIRATG